MSGFTDPYVYPGTQTLKNKLGITDAARLDRVERRLVAQRKREGVQRGTFDLAHLCAMHHHLFQDIYWWAGQLRTVEIAKGSSRFLFHDRIEMGMADVYRRLGEQDYLHGLNRNDFAATAGKLIGDINYIHPFREGNGRTQLLYLSQLGDQAGHPLDLTRLDPKAWIEASKAAREALYGPMIDQIAGCMEDVPRQPDPTPTKSRGRGGR